MPLNIAMVLDFFYPQVGGVEFHVFHLAQKLTDLGHSVVIVTHSYGPRTGVRVLTNGLRVYYCPMLTAYRSSISPTLLTAFPALRAIFIREQIDIVHGHGSYLCIGAEGLLHGRTMGLKTVFTDHLLFGFADVRSIVGNKILKFTVSDVSHVICVSNTCKENTVLRGLLDPLLVSVIPNAVISEDFAPGSRRSTDRDRITVVVISRLFPNKGADLLTAIIPRICAARDHVDFLIAGDGPKFMDLEQMREKHYLQDRVSLIGAVKHEEVRSVMVQGDIYLHPLLTEAFGTVIVEAASCGLYVVTTKVGGIPEVLPGHMTSFAEPEEDSLVHALLGAIDRMKRGEIDTSRFHSEVAAMYSWQDVAKRTEAVYMSLVHRDVNPPLFRRLAKYYFCGVVAGKLYVLIVIVDIFIYLLLEYFYPAEHIDLALKWPRPQKSKGLAGPDSGTSAAILDDLSLLDSPKADELYLLNSDEGERCLSPAPKVHGEGS